MTAATCREVQGAIAREDADPALIAATARHLRACDDCRAHDRARARIRDGILAAGDDLDDLTRARVLARLLEGQRLGRIEIAPGRGAGVRLGWRLAFSAVAAVVLVLAVTGVLRSRRSGIAPAPFALEPYAVHGNAVPAASSVPSAGLDRVELPAHASMRARLGQAADFVLLGPLELAVRDGDDARAAVELRRGTLIGDFDGSTGRRLRIVTADATVDIVGTRFLVEASAERTRVSVEHGRVRVESRGQVRLVGAREEWSTDRPDVEALDVGRASLFERAARGKLEDLAPEALAAPASAPPPGHAPAVATPPQLPLAAAAHGAPKWRHEPAPRGARASAPAGSPALARAIAMVSTPIAEASAADTPEAPAPDARAAVARTSKAPPSVEPPSDAPPSTPAEAPADTRPPASRPRETASSIYRRAEAALRQGDGAAGKKLLDELVRTFPDQPATDSARYELALMAEKAGQSGEALSHTREILRPGAQGPFVEPAHFLRCRIYLAQDRGAAATCLARFVSDFPGSPHDEVALRALIDLSRESGRCDDARRFAEAYRQRHPAGGFTAEVERARSRCGP